VSEERRFGRRALFDVLRAGPASGGRRTAHPDTSFSLDAFYARRAMRDEATAAEIPPFKRRARLEPVETAHVGSGLAKGAAEQHGAAIRAEPSRLPGVVRVRRHACLAWQRSFCSVCVERCAVPGAIIVKEGRPTVDEARCTGCGVCVGVCPAPVNGFELVPRAGAEGTS
jgi:ferredoxin